MLDLSTAVLCDFAQVRDRLLFVSSGAVSRLYRQELPSPLGLMVGLVIEVPLEDAGMEHRLRAEVINRHGTVLATLDNTFRVSDAGLFPHEVQQVPLVLSITGVRARTWGTHQVRLYLDDDLVRALTLYVVPAAAPQTAVRAAPTQSRVADDEGTVGATPADEQDDDPTALPDFGEAPAPQPDPAADDAPVPDDLFAPDVPDAPDVLATPEPAAPVADDQPIEAGPEPEAADEPDLDLRLNLDPELDLEVAPSPGPPPVSPWRTASIDAPVAEEAPAPRPSPEVFDFDEDDLDADPAQRPADPRGAREPSRFSFRYRYEDEEG